MSQFMRDDKSLSLDLPNVVPYSNDALPGSRNGAPFGATEAAFDYKQVIEGGNPLDVNFIHVLYA
jgi:hypothetical protein